jgi:2-amino-4-hydroxy-6-hydroxymethyldihydropteridine diphosphokinase
VSNIIKAYLGIGANLGDRAETLRQALVMLNDHDQIDVLAVSGVYETGPVGVLDQPDFLNATAEIETSLDGKALLDVLLETELHFGRKRIKKWGPRVLDLDILLYGLVLIDEPGLNVPHPYLHLRGFVLHPLCDLIPDAIHPTLERSFRSLLDEVDDGAVHRVDNLMLWHTH